MMSKLDEIADKWADACCGQSLNGFDGEEYQTENALVPRRQTQYPTRRRNMATTSSMVNAAIRSQMKTHRGVSYTAIRKYIVQNYEAAHINIASRLKSVKRYILGALEKGKLERTTGYGVVGSFRLPKFKPRRIKRIVSRGMQRKREQKKKKRRQRSRSRQPSKQLERINRHMREMTPSRLLRQRKQRQMYHSRLQMERRKLQLQHEREMRLLKRKLERELKLQLHRQRQLQKLELQERQRQQRQKRIQNRKRRSLHLRADIKREPLVSRERSPMCQLEFRPSIPLTNVPATTELQKQQRPQPQQQPQLDPQNLLDHFGMMVLSEQFPPNADQPLIGRANRQSEVNPVFDPQLLPMLTFKKSKPSGLNENQNNSN